MLFLYILDGWWPDNVDLAYIEIVTVRKLKELKEESMDHFLPFCVFFVACGCPCCRYPAGEALRSGLSWESKVEWRQVSLDPSLPCEENMEDIC